MSETFKRRSSQAEIMDDQDVDYKDFSDCLRSLETVNILTMAYRPAARWLRQVLNRPDNAHGFSILDAGCGGGDTLRFIARCLARLQRRADLTGVDLNPWSRQYIETCPSPAQKIDVVTSNIFDYAPTQKIDYIISSLFTHHMDDNQLVIFLRWMEERATKGWFINDLHRHPLAFYGFRFLSKLLRFHYMVQHDGPVSVARAFTKNDWLALLDAGKIPREYVEIKWFFPFRYCLTRHKT